jgi:hypothetical protein
VTAEDVLIPDGFTTLREIMWALEKALVGREPFCEEDRAEIAEGATPEAREYRAALARRRGVVQAIWGALRREELTAFVRSPTTGERFRIPGFDWLCMCGADQVIGGEGRINRYHGAHAWKYEGRLVIVPETDAKRFVEEWGLRYAQHPLDAATRPPVPVDALTRFIEEEADRCLQEHRRKGKEQDIRDAAVQRFSEQQITDDRWVECWARLPASKKRRRGETDKTLAKSEG